MLENLKALGKAVEGDKVKNSGQTEKNQSGSCTIHLLYYSIFIVPQNVNI